MEIDVNAGTEQADANAAMKAAAQPGRHNPKRFVYRGLPLWISFEQQSGVWSKIVVSYRVEDGVPK